MKKVPLIAGALLLAAGSANAADLGYKFVDISYESLTLDDAGFEMDGDRIGIEGSFAFGKMLFVEAGYNTTSFDESGLELSSDVLFAGVGAHFSMTPNVDFVASAGFVMDDSEATIPGFGTISDDDTGFYLKPGIRGMVGRNFELFGNYEYVDVYEDGNSTLELGGRYHVSKAMAVTFQYVTGDYQDIDIDGFGVGLRIGL